MVNVGVTGPTSESGWLRDWYWKEAVARAVSRVCCQYWVVTAKKKQGTGVMDAVLLLHNAP